MDENVKNDAKQVMLVQNADDGRLQAVTGVDQDGNIQTADPTDQNVASLLNVNTQDSALEAFFKKFMEQAQNPVHTGIFVMTENALNKLIRIDFDPEILENYRIDPSERLQTQEQRQFEPLDVTKIDLADMEKKGIRMEDIEPHLKAMSYGHKSNGLVEMNPELENGMRVSTKGRVSLEEQADGSLRVVPHYWQERPDLDAPLPRGTARRGGENEPDEHPPRRESDRPGAGAGQAHALLRVDRQMDEHAGTHARFVTRKTCPHQGGRPLGRQADGFLRRRQGVARRIYHPRGL